MLRKEVLVATGGIRNLRRVWPEQPSSLERLQPKRRRNCVDEVEKGESVCDLALYKV